MKSLILASVIGAGIGLPGSGPACAHRYGSKSDHFSPALTGTVHDYRALVVSISHRLTRSEARRRLKNALASVQRNYSFLLVIEKEIWIGYRLGFRARVFGQTIVGSIDVTKHRVNLNVRLPPSLAILVEIARPILLKEGASIFARR